MCYRSLAMCHLNLSHDIRTVEEQGPCVIVRSYALEEGKGIAHSV